MAEWNHVVVDTLQYPLYERIDDGVHEPQNGWIDSSQDYRITGASGELVVGPDAETINWADVTFDRTVAGSSLVYLRERDDPVRYDLEYEMWASASNVEAPGWVEDVRSGETGGTDDR